MPRRGSSKPPAEPVVKPYGCDYSVSLPHTYAESAKSDELATTWEQVKTCIQNGSWQAVYAKDDSEFDSVVAKMRSDADSYGYQECIEWCENEAALRKAAEYE